MSKSVAIVTGASQGIGRATAIRLARDFGALVLVARGGEKLGEVGQQIRAIGAEPLVLVLTAATEIIVKKALDSFGRIDALLNIAGAVPGLDLFQMTDDQWSAGTELKFHGARRLTIRAWDALRESKGAVVFISGNSAVIRRASAAAIGAINAAIEALAKALADRGIDDGVQVNSISPGAIKTGRRVAMLKNAAASKKVPLEEAEQQFLRRAGVRRFGEAEEIANLVAFAVSPGARWMTGTVLRMDGGEVKSV